MRFKKLTAGIMAAVMMLTAVATPLGDNLPAVRDSVSMTASAASNPFGKWQTINGVTTIRCTYYAWQQAYDNTGVTLPMLGNGCQWYNNAKNAGYSVGTTAKAKSIAVWGSCSNNSYGHVAYVVSVNGNKMTVNEGGRSDATSSNGIVNGFSCGSTIGSKRYSGSPLIGFIYLDSTSSSDDVKLLNTSSHYTDEVYDDNAIVHGEVNKPTSYPVTRIGIQVRKDGNTYSNGWSRFDNTQKTYTNSSWMSPWFNIKTELGVTLVHSTRYYYQFYAVVNGKEYWSSENTFVTTGSHSYGSWYTTTSATCKSGGTEERKCSCGATETRSTSALGHDYGSTYFEADHPHKYAHLCQRCGYKEFTGGNLDYYEKCDTCNKPEATTVSVNVTANCGVTNFEWTTTNRTEKYVLKIFKDKAWQDSAVQIISTDSTSCSLTLPAGYYEAYVDSCNGSIYTCSNIIGFTVLEHDYTAQVVKPTYTSDGFTEYTCSSCGDSYIDNYTEKLSLEPVSGVKLTGRAADALRINWTKNASADGYIVEMYQGNKWVRAAKITNNNTTTLRKAGLKAGTVYKFRVKAYKMSGKTAVYGAYSATVAARTNPSFVKGAKLTGRAADALRINWTKNTSADGYIVEMYQNGKWVRVAKITNNSTTTFRKAGLKASTVYKFRVRAYKMSGSTALYGNYSATVTARTNPSIVKGVKIAGKAKDALRVNWTKNTSAQGYIVEMYKGGKWVRVAKITNSNTTTFRKAGLAKNTAYKFRVCAYYMSGKTALYGNYGSVSGKTAAK